MLTEAALGNPHHEAWVILSKPFKGMQARSSHLNENLSAMLTPAALLRQERQASDSNQNWLDWYTMLLRTSKDVLHLEPTAETPELSPTDALHCCLTAHDGRALKLEAAVLQRLRQLRRKNMSEVQLRAADEFMQTDEVSELVRRMCTAGVDEEVCSFLIDAMFLQRSAEIGGIVDNDDESSERERSDTLAEKSQAREVVSALQRELRTEDPLIGGLSRWGGQTIALKGALGAAAIAGAGAVAAPVLAVTGALWWTYDILNMNVGSSYGIVMQAIVTIVTHRLILAMQGVCIEEYSQEAKDDHVLEEFLFCGEN